MNKIMIWEFYIGGQRFLAIRGILDILAGDSSRLESPRNCQTFKSIPEAGIAISWRYMKLVSTFDSIPNVGIETRPDVQSRLNSTHMNFYKGLKK